MLNGNIPSLNKLPIKNNITAKAKLVGTVVTVEFNKKKNFKFIIIRGTSHVFPQS